MFVFTKDKSKHYYLFLRDSCSLFPSYIFCYLQKESTFIPEITLSPSHGSYSYLFNKIQKSKVYDFNSLSSPPPLYREYNNFIFIFTECTIV